MAKSFAHLLITICTNHPSSTDFSSGIPGFQFLFNETHVRLTEKKPPKWRRIWRLSDLTESIWYFQKLGTKCQPWNRRKNNWRNIYLKTCIYIGPTPHAVTVTTRIITFLIGNPYKPSFVTVTGWGVDRIYIYIIIYIWVFPKIVVLPNHQFSLINHPFWGTTIFGFQNLIFLRGFLGGLITSLIPPFKRWPTGGLSARQQFAQISNLGLVPPFPGFQSPPGIFPHF